jgi:hypothetical protein
VKSIDERPWFSSRASNLAIKYLNKKSNSA